MKAAQHVEHRFVVLLAHVRNPLRVLLGQLDQVRWQFATTMPEWPHWYVLKDWCPEWEAAFVELVRRIFDLGRDEPWGAGTPDERTVRYYYLGEYKYWVMDPSIEETDLINRARIDGKGPADGCES